MFFDKRYTEKPKGDVGFIVNSLSECNIELKELADKVSVGCSFIPALLRGGKSNDNFVSQELWALDFDHNSTIDDILNRCKNKGLEPVFGYTSFSHTPDNQRFRLVFHSNRLITDIEERNKIQRSIMNIFPECDPSCYSASHFFYGGKQQILYDENKLFDPDEIIQKYYKPPQSPTKSQYSEKSKNQTRSLKKDSLNHKAKIEAISNLDVKAMRKLLGIDNNSDFGLVEHSSQRPGGVLVGGNNKSSSLLPPTKSPDTHFFRSKQELKDYIYQIDLYDYLGVSQKKFKCILPEHNDTKPSANVFESKNGTLLYKCFGCDKTRTIVGITEHLSGCKRHEAINFIKAVYGLEYEESDWVKEQKDLLIDSVNYLDSEEFETSFNNLPKVLGYRKPHLQKIMIHCVDYINEDCQVDGKPVFYQSYNKLMKVCGVRDSTKLSQSLHLFALLGMMEILPESKIPTDKLNKAKNISATYGFEKITNFYQFEEYGINTLTECDERAKQLRDNHFKISACTREMLLRTYDKKVADEIYPQYTYNNNQGTSEKSDKHTLDIARVIEYCIDNKGYATEKDVIQLLAKDYNCESTKRQLAISMQEILNTYSLQRVRLNKELKEKLSFESNGYPFVILRKEENEVNT